MIKYIDLEVLNLGRIKNLIYSFGEREDLIESLSNNVINSEEIPGAIPAYISKEGIEYKVRYQITNESPLRDYLQADMGKNGLVKLIKSFLDAVSKAKSKSININNYLLNIDNIYIDLETGELSFIYIPLKDNEEKEIDLHSYIKELVSNVKYDLNDDLYFFVALHNYLNDSNSDIYEVLTFMKDIKQDVSDNNLKNHSNTKSSGNINTMLWEKNDIEVKAESIDIKNIEANGILAATNIKIDDSIENTDKAMSIHISTNNVNLANNNYYYDPCQSNRETSELDDDDYYDDPGTTVLDDYYDDEETNEGTTLLDDEEENIPFLINKVSREKYELTKSRVKIGREVKSCDFIINNKLVGRIHAIITLEGKNYYIEDNSSTNGTFINGTKLPKMGKAKISNGDEIKLANDILTFKLY